MRSLKKHQYKTNELFLRCQHTVNSQMDSSGQKTRGLESGAGAPGRAGHPKSRVKGVHWGLHTVKTRLRAPGNERLSVSTRLVHFFKNGLPAKCTGESPSLEDLQVGR